MIKISQGGEIITYFSWWYGEGLSGFWQAIKIMTEKIYSFFSIRILIRTLFDPWKRDEYGAENASLEKRLKLFLNNLISRLIGFVVRLFTILVGLIAVLIFFALLFMILVAWLALPLVIILLIINGARTMING